jgi:para-nitrobenzyl esterase
MDRSTSEIQTVLVETAMGKLAGLRKGDVLSFTGIPFANPPVGALRWRMAEPNAPWAGIRDATRFGPICLQSAIPLEALTGGVPSEQSEDCLYLNVWTPGLGGAKRPVMVWIHGGGFAIGAGSQAIYNGARLAARDVVVVTINYRLGAFGFLDWSQAAGPRLPGSGTEGLGDQILALDWVKRNISAFGGDPENVTIFGESAGAMSVGALLASPVARGLFHKAVAQSGAAHIGYDRERAARVTRAMLDALGIDASQASRVRELPANAILNAQAAVLAQGRSRSDARKLGALPFQPVIDGALLSMRPIEALRAGSASGIPVLAGTTRDEWKLFTAADPRLRLMSMRGLSTRVTRLARDAAPELLDAYRTGSPFDRFNAIMTDKNFTLPAIALLKAQAAWAPVFTYRFDWRSPWLGGIMGACHALELGFVFGTHSQRLASVFFGAGAAAEQLAAAMMDCWTAFARAGDPSSAATGHWRRYDSDGQGMIFGDGDPYPACTHDLQRLRAWAKIPERKLGP